MKLLLFILFFTFIIPEDNNDNHRNYYFPIDNFLLFPKVYVYSSDYGYYYWHLETTVSNLDTIFTTSIYDDNFNLRTQWKELINKDGWEGIELSDSYYDKSKYLISDIFLWNQKKGHITKNIILNTDSQGVSEKTSFTREYINKDTIPYSGNMVDALIYEDYYTDYPILHYYIKNIGRAKTLIDNQIEIHLVDIIEYHEFSILKYKNNFK